MDDCEVLARKCWDWDAWWGFRERERWEKCERQVRDCFTEFGAGGAVPGINFVERFQRRTFCILNDADQIEPGVGYRSCFIGETDQRQCCARCPDFGVIGSGGFESWEREDYVADGAGADQEASRSAHRLILASAGPF
jgi:hypothetical protein